MGDLNPRVGDEEVENVVGSYGVPDRNESGEKLIELCTEHEMVVGNSLFKKKEIGKYTWVRMEGGSVVDRAVMDYIIIRKMSVRRGAAGGMSDHFLVEGRLRLKARWVTNGRSREARTTVKVQELSVVKKAKEYLAGMEARYDAVAEE